MKDPAFLFYTNDFLSGTQFLTDEQVGKFVRLLMAQHQHGHLSKKQMLFICKSYDEDIFSKFKIDEAGKYYNERLEIEADKRKKFVESRSRNKSGRIKELDQDDEKTYDISYENHMVNRNRNRNESKDEGEILKKTDTFENERNLVISELNSLTNRKFDPNAEYLKKELNARIKQYGVEDLLDMIRFMVYKRKGSDFEQYLKPDTMFANKKCASYMVDMKHYRENNIAPKKDIQVKTTTKEKVKESGKQNVSFL